MSNVPVKVISDASYLLQAAVKNGVFDCKTVDDVPLAILYDLDAWEGNLRYIYKAFGENFLHAIALKANSVGALLKKALDLGCGAECASIGEVANALACGFPPEKIIFDSPVKTAQELIFAINKGIHVNIDNESELQCVADLYSSGQIKPIGTIGLRINPLVGAGAIAALSVSTGDSKFGIPRTTEGLLDTALKHDFINCIHGHVGSGGMGLKILVEGAQIITDFAMEVNKKAGKRQIHTIDIGGGMPVNYGGDSWTSEKVPSFQDYADALRAECPDLFTFKCVTEFGQSANAKGGILASRIQYIKNNVSGPVSLIHFGADCCPRQVYTGDHARRLEFYRADGSAFPPDCETTPVQSVAGPLCFQGDFFVRNAENWPKVQAGDFVIMKDAGANTLALFSRHCSRLAPPVYGLHADGRFECLKPRETMEEMLVFWGTKETKDNCTAQ
eukprot:GEMP01037575.1.p1 GENE.GEMP01037575.1~~GEMP01037575.1.p1  ORF type:complete len:446 (-),score=100.76 GEMP01037575.1:552-1889(-)